VIKKLFFSLLIFLAWVNLAIADWPVSGNWPDNLSSDFGPRYTSSFHEGLDFALTGHTAVKAVRSGKVNQTYPPDWEGGNPNNTGYGWRIYIANDVYGHLEPNSSCLTAGQLAGTDTVPAGQQIGWSGNTGDGGTYHLHFEISPGDVNPLRILSYTSGTPSIESTELTGNVTRVGNTEYVKGQVQLNAYVETTKKDLNSIKFEISPARSGFPKE